MSGWFWRRAFGPRPSLGTLSAAMRVNGSAAAVVTSARKNASIAKGTARATVATRGGGRAPRQATDTTAAARMSVQSRIEPASAAQSEIAPEKGGVPRGLVSGTQAVLE